MTEGQRFSQVYLEKGAPVKDSQRMRNRVSAKSYELLNKDDFKLISLIESETGAKVPWVGSHHSLKSFFEKSDIRDFLDSITIIHQFYRANNNRNAMQWRAFISRVFKEENIGYQLDAQGGVHFFIDEEFEKNRASVIAGLDTQPAVKEAFEKAHAFLDSDPQDTSSAVKSVFEAAEILYKHTVDAEGKERLNGFGINKLLKPLFQDHLKANPTEVIAMDHLLDGFCDWVEAGHMYRHGQKVDEPAPPSLDFAIQFVSQGAGYIRALLVLLNCQP